MKSFLKNNYLLILIIVFGGFLRLYNLSSIPISLNPDELAIGYNAYSILTTGKGEWGETIPLAIKSFGDWKLPVYQLLTIPFIYIFSLNEFSVRILSAISGILSIFLVYRISFFLFKNKTISHASSLFMAISPWMIIFSRGALEPNLGVTLYLLGFYFFIEYLEHKKYKSILIGLSGLSFGLTLFTYHPFMVFTPLFLIVLFIFFRKMVDRKSIIIGVLIFSIFVALTGFTLLQGSGQKLSSVGVFNNTEVIYNRADIYRADMVNNPTISKALYNKYTTTPYHIAQNYLLTFSPKFLFDGETTKLFYGIGGFGFLYILDALFIIAGIYGLATKKEKNRFFLFTWILISPISSAITVEAPSVSRLIQIVPALMILTAYGIIYLFNFVKEQNILKLAYTIIIFLFVLNFIYFVDQYYNHMNYYRAKFFHYGYKEAVEIANKYPDKNIVMAGPDNFPYISFLFYNKYDPEKFRTEVVRYAPEKNGFVYVKSFGRYSFVKQIDRKKLKNDTVYIDFPSESDNYEAIYTPSGEKLFSIIVK